VSGKGYTVTHEEGETRRRPKRALVNSRGKDLKQERALRTRAQIIAETARAFAERGYNAVTVQDVAEMAGVTAGAVYFHFANKQQLAMAVSDEFYARWPALAAEVEMLGLAPFDALIEFLRRTGSAFQNDTVVQAGARLQIERIEAHYDLPVPFDGYERLLATFVAAACEDGGIDDSVDPDVLNRVLLYAVFGAQHISWVRSGRADLSQRIEEIIRIDVEPLRQAARGRS
jgi:AcrR family transcriptional regulator